MIEIVSRWDHGKVLYKAENAQDVRSAVVEAAKARKSLQGAYLRSADLRSADLSGADLSGAYLRSADLRSADLSGAYLRSADLRSADLSGADLSGADLSGAYLSGADLRSAYLSGAYLRSAYLRSAYLSGADLSGAYLRSAYLSGAYLSGAIGLAPDRHNDLRILLDQPGKIRAYKLVTEDGMSPMQSRNRIKYEIGQTLEVEDADTDEFTGCGAGINVATLPWVLNEWRTGYRVLVVEFTAKDIAAIPHSSDGKFRVHRCKVVGEKELDLVALGLVKAPEPETKVAA